MLRKKLNEFVLKFVDNPLPLMRRYYATCRKLFPAIYTDADPFKIIWIDPSRIQYEQGLRYDTRDGPTKWARVVDGDWDANKILFEDCFKYTSIKKRYTEQLPWEETKYYQQYMKKVKYHPPVYGCSTPDEMHDRFIGLDNVYESIVKEGFLTQRQLLSKSESQTRSASNDGIHPFMNEITVNITSDGSLIYSRSGRNRLCMAKVADVEKVPVQVRTRHKSWQQVRDEVRKTGHVPAGVSNHHPDLQDILNSQDQG